MNWVASSTVDPIGVKLRCDPRDELHRRINEATPEELERWKWQLDVDEKD